MRFLIDTHVHIYPFHRTAASLRSLLDNMTSPGPSGDGAGTARIACLTERHDCFEFDRIASGSADGVETAFAVARQGDTVLHLSSREGAGDLYLVAGQQIVTAENIELLALNMTTRVAEGVSSPATVDAVLAAGGMPVAAWGVGKWLGSRGAVVRDLLSRYGPAQIALGDTSMRPQGWGTPFIMRAARRRGFRVLAGSDPLPFAGEEARPGCYHSVIEAPGMRPAEVVGALFQLPAASLAVGGSRGSPITVARRILAHMRASH